MNIIAILRSISKSTIVMLLPVTLTSPSVENCESVLMAFEGLADKISNAFKKLKSKGKLSENDVKGAMREVRLALLEADVNYKVAKDFTNRVTERAVGADILFKE